MNRPAAAAGSSFFFIAAPGTVAGLVPWWLSRWQIRPAFFGLGLVRWVGMALVLAGLCVLLQSFARFAWEGSGTPAPVLPTKTLVVSGFYRHVRNPMYLALVTIIFGQGLIFTHAATVAYGALVWLVSHIFVVLYEEPALRQKFGAQYTDYCNQVPRWSPRLRGWAGA